MNGPGDPSRLFTEHSQGTRFILVRHGETDWNRERRFQGHIDIALNNRGLAQAHQLKAYLQHMQNELGHPLYQRCISSDLDRARTTARIIHGEGEPPVMLSSALRERHYGHLSGLTAEEMEQKSPLEYAGLKTRQADAQVQGGESLSVFFDRVISEFQRIARQHVDQSVLVVAHGGVLDCIYRHCTGTPLEKPRAWLLPNCALNLVALDSEGKGQTLLWAWQGHQEAGPADRNMDEVDGRIT